MTEWLRDKSNHAQTSKNLPKPEGFVRPNRSKTHLGDSQRFAEAFAAEFPDVDPEESEMLDALLPPLATPSRVADLGCGQGRLLGAIRRLRPAARLVGIDSAIAALRLVPVSVRGSLVCGDFARVPMANGFCDAVVSGLLSLNYAGSEESFRSALSEAARIARPGASLYAEIALAWEPARLAGLAESHGLVGFLYHDKVAGSPGGCVLRAQIDIGAESSHFELFVPALGLFPRLLADCGWELEAFFAPHELASRTLHPPADCLRAVVLAHRN